MNIDSETHRDVRKVNFVEITILFTSFIAATYGFGVYLFSTILTDMRSDLQLYRGWRNNLVSAGWIFGGRTYK